MESTESADSIAIADYAQNLLAYYPPAVPEDDNPRPEPIEPSRWATLLANLHAWRDTRRRQRLASWVGVERLRVSRQLRRDVQQVLADRDTTVRYHERAAEEAAESHRRRVYELEWEIRRLKGELALRESEIALLAQIHVRNVKRIELENARLGAGIGRAAPDLVAAELESERAGG